ncbi:MAG: hypothetical protein IT489_03150 [Gammaproteobacteria bacterium]|nr:hypothetical protein [Gammaproteobacteria bacterium]
MKHDGTTLSRREIRSILRVHRGSAAHIARHLGIGPNAISMWLRKRSPSRRLDLVMPAAARALASGQPLDLALSRLSLQQKSGD